MIDLEELAGERRSSHTRYADHNVVEAGCLVRQRRRLGDIEANRHDKCQIDAVEHTQEGRLKRQYVEARGKRYAQLNEAVTEKEEWVVMDAIEFLEQNKISH